MSMLRSTILITCTLFVCVNLSHGAITIPHTLRDQDNLENSISQSLSIPSVLQSSYNEAVAESGGAGDFHSRKRRELSDWLIAPNTRWCGRGNIAGKYNHLGGASSADKCCRRHDHCQLYISGMSKKYDLFNYRPFTLSHCSCDRRFRTCLKMADNSDANMVGRLFFNVVQTQCFILRSETVCVRRAADGSCEKEEVKQKAYLKDNLKF